MNKFRFITALFFALAVTVIVSMATGIHPVFILGGLFSLSYMANKYAPTGAFLFTLTNLSWSQGQQNMGGIIGDIYYCPAEDIATNPVASGVGKLDTASGSTGNFTCKTGKKFISIYHTAETGKFDDTTVGDRDGKSKENLLEFFFPGSKQDVNEFERFALNTPCVVICKDTSGNYRVLGIGSFDDSVTTFTSDIPAYLESSSGTTGTARADRRGKTFQFKHSANHAPIYYKGTIPLTPAA